jgi:hypothetical protein
MKVRPPRFVDKERHAVPVRRRRDRRQVGRDTAVGRADKRDHLGVGMSLEGGLDVGGVDPEPHVQLGMEAGRDVDRPRHQQRLVQVAGDDHFVPRP